MAGAALLQDTAQCVTEASYEPPLLAPLPTRPGPSRQPQQGRSEPIRRPAGRVLHDRATRAAIDLRMSGVGPINATIALAPTRGTGRQIALAIMALSGISMLVWSMLAASH